jgi:uncharacterized membrane protein
MSDRVLRRASVTLSGAGIGIAGYLTYVHYAGLHPICGISHGCETVQTSSYAYLAGLPVALLGLIAYVLILATLRGHGENAFLAGYILTLIAFGFSVYLTYREVFTIHTICSWCVSSAIVFTLLALVGTLQARRLGRTFPTVATQTSAGTLSQRG